MGIEVSVMTATYNRADTLHRVWNSLRNQTIRNFEWIIIDDGSTDHTGDVVDEFIAQSDFPITYLRQRNRGKHTAYNLFARYAQAPVYCSVDSDDEILPQCLERMLHHYRAIPEKERSGYAGIMCLAQNQHGEPIGDSFWPEDFEDSLIGVLLRHKKLGDKGSLNRLETLHEFPFPEDVEQVYLPESYHIHGYSTRYKTKFVNEVLIQPWTDPRADHLSHALAERKNDAGTAYGLLAWPKYSMRFFGRNPRHFISVTSAYIAVALSCRKSLRHQFDQMGSFAGRALWVALIPLGFARYAYREWQRRTSIRSPRAATDR